MTHVDVTLTPFSLSAGPATMIVVPVTFWGACHTKYTVHLHLMEVYEYVEGEWVDT